MTRHERIILAFIRIWETAQAIELAVGMEIVAATRKQLMSVGLVPHIPHNPVVGGVEHIVKGNSQLNRTHRRREMPRILSQGINKETPDVGTHLRQSLLRQQAQIRR